MALPSVQRFISEARTTSDVASASAIYSELAGQVVRGLGEPAGRLVLPVTSLEGSPGGSAAGMPNRVVALLPAGTGVRAARAAGEAVHARWRAMVEETFREPGHDTPGFPVVQWVCVPPGGGGYPEQWARAQCLLAARRRTRDFAPLPEGGWRQREICSLSPRWPAEPKSPRHTPEHDRDARLSTVAWVKRGWRRVQREGGFPSTASIASAPYRQAVLRALAPGDGRDEDVARAVAGLERAAAEAGLMNWPDEAPVAALEELIPAPGRVGHWLGLSGGPWAGPDRELPTASTAVLYFHQHASIQLAMSTARQLLEEGKEKVPDKHALAVGYLRRSGAREASIQPWAGPDGGSSAALFRIFARDAGHGLSPRLAADLERDATELDALRHASDRVYQAELARLVRRHTAEGGGRPAAAVAGALSWLGRNEAALDGVSSPHAAAKVGAFLRQEAR